MITIPSYTIKLAYATDSLKAGAWGRSVPHWSEAPLQSAIGEEHPNLLPMLAKARVPADLQPYFDRWYTIHSADLAAAKQQLSHRLESNWLNLIRLVTLLTDNAPWTESPITIALSSLSPSSLWGGTRTIDIYYDQTDFERDILHELIHLRTEELLNQDWFNTNALSDQKRGLFMELLADIVLAGSQDAKPQLARSPYPFLTKYQSDIKRLHRERSFFARAAAAAKLIAHNE